MYRCGEEEFYAIIIDRIELFPERRKDGNWIRNIVFNFSVPLIRDGEELARVDGISLDKAGSECNTLPLELLTTDETCCLLERLRNAKDYIPLKLDMEDYYKIKDGKKL